MKMFSLAKQKEVVAAVIEKPDDIQSPAKRQRIESSEFSKNIETLIDDAKHNIGG